MIDIKLNGTHLGAKVKVDDVKGQGTIKAYNNVTRVVFVIGEGGKIIKYPYSQVTI